MCYTVVPYLLSTYERAPARSLTRFIYKHLEENILGAALVERASSITGFLGMGGKSRWWCIHECVIILYWCRVIIITRYRRHPYHTRRAQDIQQYERILLFNFMYGARRPRMVCAWVYEREGYDGYFLWFFTPKCRSKFGSKCGLNLRVCFTHRIRNLYGLWGKTPNSALVAWERRCTFFAV